MNRLLAALLLVPVTAFSQDRDGNDTPGEWIVDHHTAFGQWDSMCDYRLTGAETEQRCYVRYVDVFSARPKFAAQFVFVTPEPKVEFGLEPGTLFRKEGFRIERGGAVVWADPKGGCLVGLSCLYEGVEATSLLAMMSSGGAFGFDFIDRHGTPQSITWDLEPFAAAMTDFEEQAAARGLAGQ